MCNPYSHQEVLKEKPLLTSTIYLERDQIQLVSLFIYFDLVLHSIE
jgi:hypothetical protein